MKCRNFLVVAGAAVWVCGITVPASGQTSLTDAMKKCAAVADDTARLACYDAAVATIDAQAAKLAAERKQQAAQRAQEMAAKAEADRKAAEIKAAQAKVDAFGAVGLPADQKPAVKSDSVDELEGTVEEVFFSPLKEIIVVLDNGQMWRQTDQAPVSTVRKGDKVVIKKKTISGFRLTFVRQRRAIDVRRYR